MPYFCMKNYPNSTILLYNFDYNLIGDTCSIYLISFSSHSFIFNVIANINQNNELKSRIVVFYAYFIQWFVYIIVLFIAYFSTFQNTNEIFIDRPNETIFMVIGKAIFCLGLICNIGMFYFTSKDCFQTIFNGGNKFNKAV